MNSPPALDREAALFLDVDGTLLGIAPHPDKVIVAPGLPALLERLATARDGAIALISGRPIADLDRLFHPWRGAAAGLHGFERRHADGHREPAPARDADLDRMAEAAIERIRPELTRLARHWPGTWLEDKARTLALHYRGAPQAAAAIREATARLLHAEGNRLRLIAGKMVVEFQPSHHDKGKVVAAFMAEPPFRRRMPVFVGDDTTDEDGFAEVNRRGGVSIRVGLCSRETAAAYQLPSVTSVLEWLTAGCGSAAI